MEKNHAQAQDLAITQMRKSLQNLGSSPQKYGDETLQRFLVAGSMDPEKAAKMFFTMGEMEGWLCSIGVCPRRRYPSGIRGSKGVSTGPHKRGHALLLGQIRKHFVPKDQLQFKKFVMHLLDKTIASAVREKEVGNEKLVGLMDLQNITCRNLDPRALINGLQFLRVILACRKHAQSAYMYTFQRRSPPNRLYTLCIRFSLQGPYRDVFEMGAECE